MGINVFTVFMLSFLVLAFFYLSMAGMEVNQNGDILLALELAAQAGSTMWDKEATAEAGIIMLDPIRAEEKARSSFILNTTKIKVDLSKLHVEIVNNAPITLVVDGGAMHFQSNGLIVSYGHFAQVAEVDDR